MADQVSGQYTLTPVDHDPFAGQSDQDALSYAQELDSRQAQADQDHSAMTHQQGYRLLDDPSVDKWTKLGAVAMSEPYRQVRGLAQIPGNALQLGQDVSQQNFGPISSEGQVRGISPAQAGLGLGIAGSAMSLGTPFAEAGSLGSAGGKFPKSFAGWHKDAYDHLFNGTSKATDDATFNHLEEALDGGPGHWDTSWTKEAQDQVYQAESIHHDKQVEQEEAALSSSPASPADKLLNPDAHLPVDNWHKDALEVYKDHAEQLYDTGINQFHNYNNLFHKGPDYSPSYSESAAMHPSVAKAYDELMNAHDKGLAKDASSWHPDADDHFQYEMSSPTGVPDSKLSQYKDQLQASFDAGADMEPHVGVMKQVKDAMANIHSVHNTGKAMDQIAAKIKSAPDENDAPGTFTVAGAKAEPLDWTHWHPDAEKVFNQTSDKMYDDNFNHYNKLSDAWLKGPNGSPMDMHLQPKEVQDAYGQIQAAHQAGQNEWSPKAKAYLQNEQDIASDNANGHVANGINKILTDGPAGKIDPKTKGYWTLMKHFDNAQELHNPATVGGWESIPGAEPAKSSVYSPPTSTRKVSLEDVVKPMADWSSYSPSNPFQLPTPSPTLSRAQALGYNTQVPLFKGMSKEMDADQFWDPSTKPNERAIFAADRPEVAQQYAEQHNLAPMYARAERPYEVNWPDLAGDTGYRGDAMRALIEHVRSQGGDAIVIRNIHDLGGLQTQYAFMDPSKLRVRHAAFDPAQVGSPNLLSARGLPGFGQQDQKPGRDYIVRPVDHDPFAEMKK